ncbi:GntR family transcriptional regulator [Gilvimarinus algae]|uniref:GntR family transcriptional regulator n=1 Tax=Gilvimarinus algae TaxID=3058037 RepID=A0ABT8TMZ7_9GAMM|nr:GntR family transcriptional regulator [Gilvimarinus sp. SDUM040014]MDO3383772.1 GntR family transcriptional regulator [Gilvimarinus sp. SDUM040014]
MSTATDRQSVSDRIYQALKQDIFDFVLLPGDRFTENEVAERLQASRTPVREALSRLQREGFVEVLFRAGWQVKPFDFHKFDQLYELRIILEQAAVRKLCEMQVQSGLESLKDFWLVSAKDRLTDGAKVRLMDETFHCDLIKASGNGEMVDVHQNITERLRIIRQIDFTKAVRIEATYQEHAKILRSIIKRRTDEAQRLIKTHIEESQAEVRKITIHMLHEARGIPKTSIN